MDIEDERLTTQKAVPPWVWREHLARYQFAVRYAAGARVVDCACGAGLAARDFAEAGAQTVEAFDACESVIAACQQTIRLPNLRFRTADALSLPLPNASADLFVSLETIEHLDDDRAFLAEVCRVLDSQGVFICSTPNREVTNPGKSATHKPCNRFHRREYTASEFLELLGMHFDQIELFGQNPQWQSRVRLLSLIGKFLPGHIGTRITQVLKLPRYLRDDPSYHAVVPAADGRSYEYLVAVCRRPKRRAAPDEQCHANRELLP
jgi:SAM-dependent methyltransferase